MIFFLVIVNDVFSSILFSVFLHYIKCIHFICFFTKILNDFYCLSEFFPLIFRVFQIENFVTGLERLFFLPIFRSSAHSDTLQWPLPPSSVNWEQSWCAPSFRSYFSGVVSGVCTISKSRLLG